MSQEIMTYSDYLQQSRIPIRLAAQTRSGWPAVLSLWFLFRDGEFFCATQADARIVSYLESNPKCAYEVAADLPPYCGIRGQALARIDHSLGDQVLEELILKYLGDTENSLAKTLQQRNQPEVALILKPVSVYSWDFSRRMSQVSEQMIRRFEKACP